MNKGNEIKVLVTDGNNRASLAITRSLGRAGYVVYVAGESKRSLASSSKFCAKGLSYPDPNKWPDRFCVEIVRLVHKNNIDILMPAAETTTRECMKVKDAICHQCVIPFHNFNSVDMAASKYDVLKLASGMDIPIPLTYYLESSKDLDQAIQFGKKTGFPIVVKPSRSKIAGTITHVKASTLYAHSESELRRIILSFDPVQYPLLIQERIIGDGVGIFACYNDGQEIAYFSHHRLREKPPSGGVSVFRESFPVDERLQRYASKLLHALQWHGVAMVEFKEDLKRGGYKLMEINGRFWGSLQLAIDAGVDFPLLLAKIALRQNVEKIQNYRMNVKTRWLWGDIDSLLAILLKTRRKLNLPKHFPIKASYLRSFFDLRAGNYNFEVLRFNDPLPWLFETMKWFHLI